MVRGTTSFRLIGDELGTLRLVVNTSDGTITQRTQYDAFGRVTSEALQPGFDPVPFGYAGRLYDRDTGMVHFGARDYDPEAGRWTTRDPSFFANGGANLYTYASNDPVDRHDSNGLDDTPGGGGVCIGPVPLPPLCPTCAIPKDPRDKGKGDNSGGGPLTLGPFSFSPKVGWPSLSDPDPLGCEA